MKAREEFEWALRGNTAAVSFMWDVVDVLHLWDDFIDGDRRPGPAEINDRMRRALLDLPRNPFYVQNFALLSPLIEQAILSWHTANALEHAILSGKAQPGDDAIAFIIRSDYINLLIMSARIVGGVAWAVEVAVRARRRWHQEQLDGYRKALALQAATAKELGHVLQ